MAKLLKVGFTRSAYNQLKAFQKRDRNVILDAINDQLAFEPTKETRNRKPLRPNPVADWELRVGEYRVFYEVVMETDEVWVVAVGVKERNRLIIGGQEVKL